MSLKKLSAKVVANELATKLEQSRPGNLPDYGSTLDEDEEDEDGAGANGGVAGVHVAAPSPSPEKEAVPLVDYVLNVMFVDAILSNNSIDDHCREFVAQKGLVPAQLAHRLPCPAVGAVCKSILNLAHEPQVLKQGLLHLNEVLKQLEPLHEPVPPPGGSVLLRELVSAPNLCEATSNLAATPLLHHMSAAHAYLAMFSHICRTGQADIRTITVSHWGSELGLAMLHGLSRLYTSASTVLLALCSEETLPADCQPRNPWPRRPSVPRRRLPLLLNPPPALRQNPM